MITQLLVKELFDYQNGFLIRRKNSGPALAGDVAGHISSNGYGYVSIKNKAYLVHRIIFLWNHGDLPKYVDHIDRNKSNNKIENLRPASKSQNAINSKLRSTNKSGFCGVYWNKRKAKWHVRLKIDGKSHHLGYFDCLKTAGKTYKEACKLHFKEFSV
jgi:hypothetical protein